MEKYYIVWKPNGGYIFKEHHQLIDTDNYINYYDSFSDVLKLDSIYNGTSTTIFVYESSNRSNTKFEITLNDMRNIINLRGDIRVLDGLWKFVKRGKSWFIEPV